MINTDHNTLECTGIMAMWLDLDWTSGRECILWEMIRMLWSRRSSTRVHVSSESEEIVVHFEWGLDEG
jgi:hypothetical protein